MLEEKGVFDSKLYNQGTNSTFGKVTLIIRAMTLHKSRLITK